MSSSDPVAMPLLRVTRGWEELFTPARRESFCEAISDYIRTRRWFGGKAREIREVRIADDVAVPLDDDSRAVMLLIKVHYAAGAPEFYQIPVGFTLHAAQMPMAEVCAEDGVRGVVFDASADAEFARALLRAIERGETFTGHSGRIVCTALSEFESLRGPDVEPRASSAEQSNTAILFGTSFILKSFRRLESGINPDLEIGRFLSMRGFPHTAALAGSLEYQGPAGSMSLGILSEQLVGFTDAWQFTLDSLRRFYGSVSHLPPDELLLEQAAGEYFDAARQLGMHTAEMHHCLASDSNDQAFRPEPLDAAHQREVAAAFEKQAVESLALLKARMPAAGTEEHAMAAALLALEPSLIECLRATADGPFDGLRQRVHGDYHLGQVLHRAGEFRIIDFEGEPARPLDERRRKQSPLCDVAGMMRSFDYAAQAALAGQQSNSLQPWARLWSQNASSTFFVGYILRSKLLGMLPGDARKFRALLDAHMLNKAAYELAYELNNRPSWVRVPLSGMLALLSGE